jgi:hypothetical protein
MYESLTVYISKLEDLNPGEWIIDRENDGAPEHPIHVPWVQYSETVNGLEIALLTFFDARKDLDLTQYGDILEEYGIRWKMTSMNEADVSNLDAVVVLALLVGAYRAERFCDGALLRFVESGCIVKWLRRLREIDERM